MIIYGKQLFLHALEHHSEQIQEIFLNKEVQKPLFGRIVKLGLKINKVDNQKAQALCKGGNHQGFIAKMQDYKFAPFSEVKKRGFLLILCGLSDVGNIGALVRTAHALGAGGVVWIAKNEPSMGAVEGIIRASSAAAFEIPICVANDASSVVNELRQMGFKIYAAAAGGSELKGHSFTPQTALILGSEGEGIPQKIAASCDDIISVKMRQGWDSLNVSAAGAILLDRIINGQ